MGEKGGKHMEGTSGTPPIEESPKKSRTKLIAIVVVVILLVVAIGAGLVLYGGNGSATASATADKTIATTNATDVVTFNGAASTATGTINNYTWNFGDGAMGYTGPSITHHYATPGKYLVLLTVKDDKGNSGTNWKTLVSVEVTYPQTTPAKNDANATRPFAFTAASSSVVKSGASIAMDGSSSAAWGNDLGASGYAVVLTKADIANITWSFGDGSSPIIGNYSTATAQNHTFTGDGNVYVVQMGVQSSHTAAPIGYYDITVVVLPKNFDASSGVKNPDTLVVATYGDSRWLDPAVDYESAGNEIIQNCYETLVWYNGSSTTDLIPVLATTVPTEANGGISADGLTWVFHIRSGVKFHDGNIMTPEDVAFSMQRTLYINHLGAPSWILGQALIPGYTNGVKINNTAIANCVSYNNTNMTVTFHLAVKYPAFIQCLAYTVASVTEKSWVQANMPQGDQFGVRTTYLSTHVMGTGPFKLGDWAQKQYIRLDRFDGYWQGPAKMTHVLIEQISSQATREMLLFSGDADMITVNPEYRNDVRNRADVRIVEGLTTFTINFIGLNQNITVDPSLAYGDIPITFFSDIHVRKAFVAAFDDKKFISDVLQGAAVQPNSVIPNNMTGWTSDTPYQQYDAATIVAELKLATDTRPGHTGSYWDNGFTINMYYNADNTARMDGCLMIKAALENASKDAAHPIKVIVSSMEWSAFTNANDNGNMAVFYLGWMPDYADADDYVQPFLLSTGIYGGPQGLHNATLDALIIDASHETNETQRLIDYAKISKSAYDNAIDIYTDIPTNFHAERTWVHGYSFNPMYSGQIYYHFSKS